MLLTLHVCLLQVDKVKVSSAESKGEVVDRKTKIKLLEEEHKAIAMEKELEVKLILLHSFCHWTSFHYLQLLNIVYVIAKLNGISPIRKICKQRLYILLHISKLRSVNPTLNYIC